MTDTEMLDWLQKNAKGYGLGWVCRNSTSGRGLRLHETSSTDAQPTIRDAIAAFMKESSTSLGRIAGKHDSVDDFVESQKDKA